MEKNTHWRLRRELINLNYAPNEAITNYLQTKINDYLKEQGAKELNKAEIEHIVQCIGGCMADLWTIIACYLRGDSIYHSVDNLVSDSINKVITLLENILQEDKKDKEDNYEKYLRLWDLMKLLSEKEYVSRNEIVSSMFSDNPAELKAYELGEIIHFTRKLVSHNSEHLKSFKYIASEPGLAILQQHTNPVWVSAALPRLRMAFRYILNEPECIKHKDSVKASLKKKKMKKKKEDYLTDRNLATIRRSDLFNAQNSLLSNADQYKNVFGEELFQKNAKEISTKLTAVETQIVIIEQKLQEIEKILDSD